ncbi:MAG TPA: hypothetical protein VL574_06335, partial [Stellaceae bacterium]|nr:hypothetical protein [Stellaceae bacterium]
MLIVMALLLLRRPWRRSMRRLMHLRPRCLNMRCLSMRLLNVWLLDVRFGRAHRLRADRLRTGHRHMDGRLAMLDLRPHGGDVFRGDVFRSPGRHLGVNRLRVHLWPYRGRVLYRRDMRGRRLHMRLGGCGTERCGDGGRGMGP